MMIQHQNSNQVFGKKERLESAKKTTQCPPPVWKSEGDTVFQHERRYTSALDTCVNAEYCAETFRDRFVECI